MNKIQVCGDQNTLIDYLYDECALKERERLEAHLETCDHCVKELESLRVLRGTLKKWRSPEPHLGYRIVSDREIGYQRPWMAKWVIAATVILVVGFALATVEIRYGAEEFVFRMGWANITQERPSATNTTVAPESTSPGLATEQSVSFLDQRSDVSSTGTVETKPSTETRTIATPLSRSGFVVDEKDLLQQVRSLISQSERRQQEELALWATELSQEFDIQRRVDQQQIQEELGTLEGFVDYLVLTSQ